MWIIYRILHENVHVHVYCNDGEDSVCSGAVFVGEVESISSLRHHYSFCAENYIIDQNGPECLTSDGRVPPADVICDNKNGLICQSKSGKPCPDYLIRFWFV